jgi:hypothetical protein
MCGSHKLCIVAPVKHHDDTLGRPIGHRHVGFVIAYELEDAHRVRWTHHLTVELHALRDVAVRHDTPVGESKDNTFTPCGSVKLKCRIKIRFRDGSLSL